MGIDSGSSRRVGADPGASKVAQGEACGKSWASYRQLPIRRLRPYPGVGLNLGSFSFTTPSDLVVEEVWSRRDRFALRIAYPDEEEHPPIKGGIQNEIS